MSHTMNIYKSNHSTLSAGDLCEPAHLYDENNNPKILPETYAVSPAELIDEELMYNLTPDCCLLVVEKATLPIS